LVSDTTFLQLQVSARYIFSLGQFRLLSRVDVATTVIDDKDELPASLRYFVGGDQTIRGYKYQSLGPEEDGEVVGGKHMLVGSVEMDFPVRPNWRAAVFYDSGNAFSDFENIDWKHGVGFGVRWLSPIGPVRVDLAHPVNLSGVRLHISMGPDL
jgi:translocation and assembly module TamA